MLRFKLMLSMLLLLPVIHVSAETENIPDSEEVMEQAKEWLEEQDVTGQFKKALKDASTVKLDALKDLNKLPQVSDETLRKAQVDIQKLVEQGQAILDGDVQEAKVEDKVAVYIMVSMSMPKQTLLNLIEQAEKIGAPLVFRGMINGSIKNTAQALIDLMGDDQEKNKNRSLSIDPTLYSRFNINQVPAFVVASQPANRCMDGDCPTPEHYVLFGDVTLDYALDRVSRKQPEWEKDIKVMRDSLRGKS